jgi:hypothetical protein
LRTKKGENWEAEDDDDDDDDDTAALGRGPPSSLHEFELSTHRK